MFEKFFSNHPYALMALIITVFAAMMIAMFANTGEVTPATCQQVSEVLDDLNYKTEDSTEYYKQQNSNLKASVYADNGNVKFNFLNSLMIQMPKQCLTVLIHKLLKKGTRG